MKLCEICGEQKPTDSCMTACSDCRSDVHDDHNRAEDEVRRLRAEVDRLTAERDEARRELAKVRSESMVNGIIFDVLEVNHRHNDGEGGYEGELRRRVRAALGMDDVKP